MSSTVRSPLPAAIAHTRAHPTEAAAATPATAAMQTPAADGATMTPPP